MNEILNLLPEDFKKPTEEDFLKAKEILEQSTPGQELKVFESMFYVSKCPVLRRDVQLKPLAYAFMKRRERAHLANAVNGLPLYDSAEAQENAVVYAQTDISRHLMGSNSIYSGVSMANKANKETSSLRFMREVFPKSGKRMALLAGGTGCGKTFAAVAYCSKYARLVNGHLNALFFDALKISEINQRREYELLSRLERVEILVVDDLGVIPGGYKADDFQAYFESLITRRFNNQKKTIITTNLTAKDLAEFLGQRIASRIAEDGLVFVSADEDLRRADA